LALSKYPVEITGLVGHKNTFGFLIMASLPWNVYLLLAKNGNSPNQKKLIIITSLIQFIALILSDSRGSLVLTISGIVFVAISIILKNNILSNFRNRLVLYISILCLGLLPVLFWNEVTWIRIAGLLSNTQSNITARPVIYQAQWKMFLNHPIFGNGVGNFVYLNIPYWTDSFRKASAPFMLPRNGHCDYLEMLSELGIIGFSITMFFWIGAIILAIKQLRKQKDLSILPNLIVLILMMIHAGFSTASRHIPAGILLWMIVGLLWHPVFKRGWFSLPQKGKAYFGIVSVTMHVIVTGLLLQIIVSDAFYLSFRKNKARKNKPVSLLQKSLKVCPFNPNALFQTAYLSLRTKEYDFALQCADQLDRTAPNLKPTDFIRGIAAFHTGDYQASLKYTNNALYREPNYFDAKLLKAKSLAKLGKCEELKKFQKPFRPPDKNMKKLDTTTIINPTVINHDSLFVIQTGYLRTKIGGPFLRKSFNKMQHYHKFKGKERKTKIDEILSLPCPPPFKEE
jgi:O-antigen ligase